MRDEATIRKELGAANEAYLKNAAKAESVWRPHSNRVKELLQELSDLITDGANDCPDCGNPPRGLKHIRVQIRNGVETKSFDWEVGCVVCPDHRAIGPTRDHAVAAWNEAQYLPKKPEEPKTTVAAAAPHPKTDTAGKPMKARGSLPKPSLDVKGGGARPTGVPPKRTK